MAIRRDDNKYTRLSLQQYDGQARDGEIVIDLDTYNVYVGDASGTLLPVSNSGGNLANAIIGNLTVTGTSNLGLVGNVTILGGNVGDVLSTDGTGNLSWIAVGSGPGNYSNANVANYLPTYTGNLNSVNKITTTGNVTVGTGAFFLGDGGLLSNVYSAANLANDLPNYSGNLNNVNNISATGNVSAYDVTAAGSVFANALAVTNNSTFGGNVTAVGNVTGGNINTSGNVVATGTVTGGNLATSGNLTVTGAAGVGSLNTTLITGDSITLQTTGTNQGINLDPNGSGNINVNNSVINNVSTPVQAGDAANKSYVDGIASGLQIKQYVNATTSTVLPTYTYNNGASGVGATITATSSGALSLSGVPVITGQRVLIKNEIGANAPYNGIYEVTNAGSVGTPFVLTRSVNDDTATLAYSAYTFDDYSNTGWVCLNTATNNPITFGTTPIEFTLFSQPTSYIAGLGLNLIGQQFNVNPDNTTTAINGSNQIGVKPGAQLINPNIGNATGTSMTVTGNITAGNTTTTGTTTTNVIVSNTSTVIGNSTVGGNLTVTGNATISNISVPGTMISNTVVSNTSIVNGNLSVAGNTTLANVTASGNVAAAGVVTDNFYYANGTPITFVNRIVAGNNITISPIGGTGAVTINSTGGNGTANVVAIPQVYFTATANGNNQTFSNVYLSQYATASDMTVFYNGALLEDGYYTLAGDTITVATSLRTGDSIDIIRQFANIANIVPQYVAIPAIYFTAPVTGNNQTFSNTYLAGYGNTDDLTVFYNGALLGEGFYTLAGDMLTINTELDTGDGISITRQLAGNVGAVSSTYGNSNVQAYLSSGTLTGDIIPQGNNLGSLGNSTNQWKDLWVSNSTIYLNSVPLGINAANGLTVGNANVVTTSPDGTTATEGVLKVDGNIIANTGYFFIGDGGLLSNISGGGSNYSNANVANYLPTYTGDLDSVGNLTVTGNTSLGPVSNVTITGGNSGEVLSTDGSGVLSWATQAPTYGNSNVAAYLPTYTGNLDSVGNLTVTGNTSLGPVGNITITGGTTGQTLTTNGSGVLSWATQAPTYGNSNVAAYLPTYTGAITSLTGNVTTTANVNAAAVSLGSGKLTLSGNLISTTADVITIDPLGDGTPAGNVMIAGSLQVTGNITYNDIVNATTNDLQWIAANNAINPAAATGGGLSVGPLGAYAQFTYNSGLNVWQSSLPIIANGGVNANGALSGATTGSFSGAVTASQFIGDGSLLTGMYANANVAAYLPTYTGNLDNVDAITASGNIAGDYFIGNGSQLTDLPASYTNANVAAYLASNVNVVINTTGNITSTSNISGGNLTTVGDVVATGNVSGGNLTTVGTVDATGNISGGNLTTVGTVDATGNISGGNLTTVGNVVATGNVSGGNLTTVGNVVATGNVSGNYFIGNGSQLTGIIERAGFAKYTRTTTQTGVAANSVVICNVLEATASDDIAVNTTSGSITLQPGKTYRMRGTVGFCNNSSATGAMSYQWWNVTTGAWVGQGGGLVSVDGTGQGYAWQSGTAEYVFTPTVITVMQFRVVGVNNSSIILAQSGASNISNWKIGAPFIDIEVLAGAAPYTNSNPPAFAAVGSVNTVIAVAFTAVQVAYNTVTFDSNNWYSTSTNRYTPQQAGYYQINCSARLFTSSGTAEGALQLRKNGTVIQQQSGAGAIAGSVSSLVYLNGTTDYVDVAMYSAATGSASQSSSFTNFSGFWVRS